MKKIFLISFLLICTHSFLKAQLTKDKSEVKNSVVSPEAKPGTYQFIYYPSKVKFFFTNSTLREIEKQRDEKIDKYIWLTPTVQVKILSKKYIESADFIPLPEKKYVDD